MTTPLTDRKAKWRKAHPKKNRARRKLDDENQRIIRKINKDRGAAPRTPILCTVKGCSGKAEVHHDGDARALKCRQHHQKAHNLRGDGPGSAGPGRSNEQDHAGGLVHHSSHEIPECKTQVKGIRHSPEGKVLLDLNKRGGYGVKAALLQGLTRLTKSDKLED